ncbi:ABC transporter permease subunit [Bdellovibrio sp. SKB1291214]|uniref:ABC transporter permease subunit n=1 Tax=Bdellovibrio sp. SKB1291214 TaxID=1732569 RepID=UPI0015952CBE|nr:ABC transporter permease subunit [Bdellovibrio sp. SKB1291214]UYL10242.1 ABC transporter permease subunit [Bdellovibrio sp. SKB1291214]
MFVYLIRRLLLMIPTFFGITLVTFVLINLAPGSPIEQKLQAIRFGAGATGGGGGGSSVSSRGDTSVNEEVIEALKKQYGFDKPIHVRYFIWLKNISRLDFGDSFTYQEPVIDVIKSKLPVSLIFGLFTLLLTYIVCIPLGVKKAITAGKTFDKLSTILLNFTYAIPPLILGIVLIVVFAGKLNLFPLGGLQSDDYESLSTFGKIWDRAHHMILPLICYTIGGFTELSILMRNSMLDVIKSDFVRTARAKGLSEKVVTYKHALRNALIPIATGLGGFLGVFLAGSLIIEQMFNLDGMGLLGYQSVLARDYNVIMGITFISAMLMMVGRILSDVIYVLIDPRIDFK